MNNAHILLHRICDFKTGPESVVGVRGFKACKITKMRFIKPGVPFKSKKTIEKSNLIMINLKSGDMQLIE